MIDLGKLSETDKWQLRDDLKCSGGTLNYKHGSWVLSLTTNLCQMQIGLCTLVPRYSYPSDTFSANSTSEAKGGASQSLNSLLDDEGKTINVSDKCLILAHFQRGSGGGFFMVAIVRWLRVLPFSALNGRERDQTALVCKVSCGEAALFKNLGAC